MGRGKEADFGEERLQLRNHQPQRWRYAQSYGQPKNPNRSPGLLPPKNVHWHAQPQKGRQ